MRLQHSLKKTHQNKFTQQIQVFNYDNLIDYQPKVKYNFIIFLNKFSNTKMCDQAMHIRSSY